MSLKITIIKEELSRALLVTEKIAARHLSLPVLQCMLFLVKDGVVTVRATNLEIGVETTLRAKVASSGVLAVPSALFSQIIQFAPSGADISLEESGGLLRVHTAGSTTTIKTLPPDEFPELPRIETTGGEHTTVRVTELLEVLRAVSYSASHSSVKPELASVFLSLSGQTLTAAATDSFRLAEKKLPVKKPGTLGPILIPARQVGDIMRTAEFLGDELEVIANEHQLSLTGTYGYVTTRLTAGAFPDYTQIIPKEFSATATLLKQDFALALRKAALFSDKFRQVTFSLDPGRKTLVCSSSQNDTGETWEEVRGAIEGEALTLSFNERYLTDCLSSIAAESITLSFSGPARPLVIRGIGDNSFLYLVMPMNK